MSLKICWHHATTYEDRCPYCVEEHAQEELEQADIEAHL